MRKKEGLNGTFPRINGDSRQGRRIVRLFPETTREVVRSEP